MQVYIQIINHLGTFDCETLNVHEEQYVGLMQLARDFYKEAEGGGGFETRLKDGSFMVIAPEVLRSSVMLVRKIKEDDNDEKDN